MDRVVEQVDDSKRVRLAGNVHPMARTEFDKGRVEPNKNPRARSYGAAALPGAGGGIGRV
jgi:hypothetical protein